MAYDLVARWDWLLKSDPAPKILNIQPIDLRVLIDHIKAIQADNMQLRAAMQAAIDIGIIPKSSALDGGANRHSAEIRVADQFRAALRGKDQP